MITDKKLFYAINKLTINGGLIKNVRAIGLIKNKDGSVDIAIELHGK